MFQKACDASALVEGAYELVTIERKRYLVIWPTGGVPGAFRALCPDQEASLVDAPFDGRTLTCPHHRWTFDGATGECTSGQTCDPIKKLAMKIEGGEVFIDVPEKKKRVVEAAAGA